MAASGGRAGRPWGELRGSCTEFNDLAVMVRSWLDDSGHTAAGLVAALVPEDFADAAVPARHRVYDMLAGAGIQIDLIEAAARHCFDGEQMVKRLRPARTLWLKATTEPTPVTSPFAEEILALSEQRVLALEKITSLQEALRIAQANGHQAQQLALLLLGLASRQRERISDLERELAGRRYSTTTPDAQVRMLQTQLERARAQQQKLAEHAQRAERERDHNKDIAIAAQEQLRQMKEALSRLSQPEEQPAYQPALMMQLADHVSVELDEVEATMSRAREMLDDSRDRSHDAAVEAGLDLPAEGIPGADPTIVTGEVLQVPDLSGTTPDNPSARQDTAPVGAPAARAAAASGEALSQKPLLTTDVEKIRAEIERDFAPGELQRQGRGTLSARSQRKKIERTAARLARLEPRQAVAAVEAMGWSTALSVIEHIDTQTADDIVAAWLEQIDPARLVAEPANSTAVDLIPLLRYASAARLAAILDRIPPKRAGLVLEGIEPGLAKQTMEAMSPVRIISVLDYASDHWAGTMRVALEPSVGIALQASRLDRVLQDSAAYELEDMDLDRAVAVLEQMRPARAAGALERMIPAKAAEALERMHAAHSVIVLIYMDPGWAADALHRMAPVQTVATLLAYIKSHPADVMPRISEAVTILSILMGRLRPEQAAGALEGIEAIWTSRILNLMPRHQAAAVLGSMDPEWAQNLPQLRSS
jgi:flagellar motility protein MotE (MotC chaperone)